jgi:hypothetical protein
MYRIYLRNQAPHRLFCHWCHASEKPKWAWCQTHYRVAWMPLHRTSHLAARICNVAVASKRSCWTNTHSCRLDRCKHMCWRGQYLSQHLAPAPVNNKSRMRPHSTCQYPNQADAVTRLQLPLVPAGLNKFCSTPNTTAAQS